MKRKNSTLMLYFNFNKFFLTFFCAVVFIFSGEAQNGKFDVQFAFKKSDCITKKITLQLQVRSHSTANNFLMGNANFRFNYDPRIIANPKITQQPHYSILGAQPINYNYALQNLNGSSAGPTVGLVSLQCLYTGNTGNAEKVDTAWTSVACLEFDLIRSDSCLLLKWHTAAVADFPITGMSEIQLLGGGNYNELNVAPGDFFNFNYCIPNNCSFIVAKNDSYTTPLNTIRIGNITNNDTSSSAKTLNTTPTQQPKNGGVVLQANGDFTYTPNKDFYGLDSFIYKVCNAENICATATTYITINQGSTNPIGVDTIPHHTPKDSTISVCMPIKGVNPGDTLSVTPCGSKNGGFTSKVDNNNQLCLTYTPNPGYVGKDTVCIVICDSTTSSCNRLPIPIFVDPISPPVLIVTPIITNQDSTITRCFSIQDTSSNPIYTTSICGTKSGAAVISLTDNTNKQVCITYTPQKGFSGLDTVCLIVCNDGGCDTAHIPVVVNPKIVPPAPPVVIVNTIATKQDSTVTKCLAITDTLSNPIYTASLCGVKNGSVQTAFSGKNICLTYTPNAGYSGLDTICVIVCNVGGCDTAQVLVTVSPKPVIPPAKPKIIVSPIATKQDSTVTKCLAITDTLANPSYTSSLCGVKNGSIQTSFSGKNICLTYTPNAGYSGLDTICVIVCNAGGCDTARVPVTVSPKPVIPPAKPKIIVSPIATKQDSTVTKCLAITDTLTNPSYTSSLCGVKNGSVQTSFSGKNICLTYTPNAGYSGLDTICVIVCNAGGCDTARVPVTVSPKPVTPPAKPKIIVSPIATKQDSTVTKCLAITDTLSNPSYTASLCGVKNGSVQTAIVGKTICLTYTANAGYSGLDTICVIVCNAGGCDTARVPVTVSPKPVIPPAKPKIIVTPIATKQDSTVTKCLAITDTLTNPSYTSSLCGVKNGSVQTSFSGKNICLTYTPNAGYIGLDTICVIVCNVGGCDTARVPLTVSPKPVNPTKPKITVVPFTTKQDSSITLCVSYTDTYAVNQIANVCGDPNGTVVIKSFSNNQVCISYTPKSSFVGKDSVCLSVCNDAGCDIVDIPITVTPKPVIPPAKPKIIVSPITTKQDSTVTKCLAISDTLSNPTYTTSLCGVKNGNVQTLVVGKSICLTYTPNAGYSGLDTICVIVCNAGGCDTARVPVSVSPKPAPTPSSKPKINGSPITTITDSTALKCFSITDTTKNATFTATSCGVSHGTVGFTVINNLVCAVYTPSKGYNGADTICLIVCNNLGGCDTAHIPVTVSPKIIDTNHPPVLVVVPLATTKNTTKTYCFTITDPDVADTHTSTICGVNHGLASVQVINNQACVSYTPNTDYVGLDSICITVCDNHGACVTNKIPVTVSSGSGGRCIDSIPPVVKFINPLYANLKSGDTIIANCVNPPIFNANSFKVTDNYDKNPSILFRDLNRTVGTCLRDGYKVLMQCDLIATDSCGNKTDFVFFVKIIDTTPPVFNVTPADVTVNNIVPTAINVTATDDCGTATVSSTESSVPYNCGIILTRTWVATDECGNTSRKSQKITIIQGLTVTVSKISGETCAKNNGSATLSFQQSAVSYQLTSTPNIVWKPTADSSKLIANNLKAGTYTVTATAPEGCTKTITVVIPDACQCTPPALTINTTPETCGGKNGSATILGGNVSAYTISWSTGAANSASVSNLSAGTYSVTISNPADATCKQVLNFSIANDVSNCCKKYTTVSTIYVSAADCNTNGIACTEVPYTQLSNYSVTDNGLAFAGATSNCNGNIGLSLAVGNHNIVFKHKTQNCSDSLFVKVACPTPPPPIPNIIPVVIPTDSVGTWCLSTFPLLHPVTVVNLCPAGSGNAALINIDTVTMCVTYKGLKPGKDSACLKITSSTGDINYVTIIVTVTAPTCGNLISPDSTIVSGTCVNGQVPVCLPVSVTSLQGYTITLDGVAYTTVLTACSNTSTQFFVPAGFHKLRFVSPYGCADSVIVGAACAKSETIITELRVGDRDTMCISSNELLGRRYYLQNLCALQSGKKVDFNLQGGTTCIDRFAKAVGTEKACYILCDEYKICDTTYMIVNVSELKAKPPVANDDNVDVLKNTLTTYNVLLNDSFGSALPTMRIVKYPLNGVLTMSSLGQITYKPSNNYCGADVATYEICTPAGCVTANINFKVACNDLVIYSAFSPNNDGRNDFFTIEGIEKLTNSSVTVYNRWGNEVFTAKNYKNDWGGTWNGTNLPDGTYFYVFNDGDGHTLSGYVQIQR